MNFLTLNNNKIKYTIAILVTVFINVFIFSTPQSHAAAVTGFNAGRIIDDAVFTNSSSMSVSQIQEFLNSKVSSCDTWGTQPASDFGRSDLTRAQFASLNGWSAPPYVCLKDFSENGLSSAQIILNVSQQFQINPQVLLVLLQKEQSLVTDTWPLTVPQYRSATGYGCPDTAACSTEYYGFTNQITWSARMFRAILNNSPTWYTPYILGNNYIYYNPDASCGGSNVYIENRSTQALYNYTPYQPNAGALAAGWGTSSCGAYGNRNFYLYFTEWFGSVSQTPLTRLSTALTVSDKKPAIGQDVTATFSMKNNSIYSITLPILGVCGRYNATKISDMGFSTNVTFAPGETKTFSYTKKVTEIGNYDIWVIFRYNNIWLDASSDNQLPVANNFTSRTPDIRVTSGVNLTPSSPIVGQTVNAKATIRNYESKAITINTAGISNWTNYPNFTPNDYGWKSNITLAPYQDASGNDSVSFDLNKALTTAGNNYRAWVTYLIGGSWYNVGNAVDYKVID